MTSEMVGVIGAQGDLGNQLVVCLREAGLSVIECDPRLENSKTIQSTIDECKIVHVCAPLAVLSEVKSLPDDTTIVLHDSVMSSSRTASHKLLSGKAAIIHMLMNDQKMVVVAEDAPHSEDVAQHMKATGMNVTFMFVDQHDRLMSRSQAPFALLCQVLLPYLYEQRDAGMLTPSGQLLVEALHSRELAWTKGTIHSILGNPQLKELVDEMQEIVDQQVKL